MSDDWRIPDMADAVLLVPITGIIGSGPIILGTLAGRRINSSPEFNQLAQPKPPNWDERV
jgi:hypothetical protein